MPSPLYALTRRLTLDDFRLDGTVIMADARNLHAMSSWLPFSHHFAAVVRAAVSERETIIDLRGRNERYERECAALDAEASSLANRHPVELLREERDAWFWGNSTARERRLPLYERALAIAMARQGQAAPVTHMLAAE